ncbi:MAG: hypothetical protein GF315_02280 [candidate division Zixibacteria bacterium]|nr:hypothetical protein [candidate division Zixibacteria bacterium]
MSSVKEIFKGTGVATFLMTLFVWIDICRLNSISPFSSDGFALLFNFVIYLGLPVFILILILFSVIIAVLQTIKPEWVRAYLHHKAVAFTLMLFYLGMVGITLRTYGIYFEDYPIELGYYSGIIVYFIRFLIYLFTGWLIFVLYLKSRKSINRKLNGASISGWVKSLIAGSTTLLYSMIVYIFIIFCYGILYGGSPLKQIGGFIFGESDARLESTATNTRDFENRKFSGRVILLGIDGLGWNMIDKLISQGQLPAFEYLKNNGSYGYLDTYKPTSSPLIWTTIATGHPPEEHGIVGYIEYQFPAVGQSVFLPLARGFNKYFDTVGSKSGLFNSYPVLATKRSKKAVWEVIDDYGGSSAVFNWWPSRPVDNISGIIVSDFACRTMSKSLGQSGLNLESSRADIIPAGFSDEIEREGILAELSSADKREFLHKLSKRPNELTEALNCLSYTGRIAMALGLYCMDNSDLNFIASYIHDTDNHFFWEYVEPEFFGSVDLSDPASNMVPGIYKSVDRVVEEFVSELIENDYLVIVSDHSIRSVLWEGKSTGSHANAPPGTIIIYGKGINRGFQFTGASVFDVAPTILSLLDLPISAELDGKSLVPEISDGSTFPSSLDYVSSYGSRSIKRYEYTQSSIDREFKEQLKALGYIE